MYDAADHLDGKHTVFGKVVGGLGTLDAMEKICTNGEERPLVCK
jgi:peptidyl-prolyl cis-trans isomerase-like 2